MSVFNKSHYKSAVKNRYDQVLSVLNASNVTIDEAFQGKTMLELGAGVGDVGGLFEQFGCKVTSVEGREENIAEGRALYPDRTWVKMDFDQEVLTDKVTDQFDYALCWGLLYHIKDPSRLIQEMKQLSRTLLVSTIVVDSDHPTKFEHVNEITDPDSRDQHMPGSKGSRFSYKWLELHLGHGGYDVIDITPAEQTSWCFWLHHSRYQNDDKFRREGHTGHCRKMYLVCNTGINIAE